MNSYNKFRRDLKVGLEYEERALNYFDYDSVEMSKGNFKEYDFKYEKNNECVKVEVKSDRLSSKTGNFFIEFECRGKPSGLNATTADYWCYFVLHYEPGNIANIVSYDCYIIPTDELKNLVKGCRVVNGGDDYLSKGYLLKIKDCSKYLSHPLSKKALN
jgi:hypothetical protein